MPDPRALPELAQLGLLLLALASALVSLPDRALERVAPLALARVWRCRATALGFVAGFALCARGLLAAPEERVAFQYLAVLTLGYGHLLGGAWFARRRMAAAVPAGVPGWLFVAFILANVLVLFGLYGWAFEHLAGPLSRYGVVLFFCLFAVSSWHVVENDLAAAAAYRCDLSLGRVGTSASESRLVGVGTFVLTAVGIGLYAWPVSLMTFGDFFSALVLYHVVAWLVFFGDRARAMSAPRARRLLRRLLYVHVPPAAAAIALVAWPTRELDPLRDAMFAPGIYAFLSTLHVVQTTWSRGLGRRA